MQWSWALGWVLVGVVVAWALARLYLAWRARAARDAALDLVLDDVGRHEDGPQRRRPEFVDDTAPAVLSVPPELERPEWDSPGRDRPPKRAPKRPPSQRWLH